MDKITLKTQEEITNFLNLKGRFDVHAFNASDYNSFITMKGLAGWEKRLFHVYRVETGIVDEMISNGRIEIVSQSGLPELKGVVRLVKPWMDKFVYEIVVSKIDSIELKEIN